jgi:hypothetical protein
VIRARHAWLPAMPRPAQGCSYLNIRSRRTVMDDKSQSPDLPTSADRPAGRPPAARSSSLLVLGEAAAVEWVLVEERMAFSESWRTRLAASLGPGDDLLLYTTRSCWHNPTRDRGRIIGVAEVTSPVVTLKQPLKLANRTFTAGCDLVITGLAPFSSGVDLVPLVPRLRSFPNPETWTAWMRRPVVRLLPADSTMLHQQLQPMLGARTAHLLAYIAAARKLAPT